MTRKGKQAGVGAGMLGSGGLIALYGVGCLIACAIIALSAVVAAWLAALVVGFFLFTSMVGLYVITPSIYPTEVRNTGTGLAIGVGRCGAILSPILAGVLLKGGWKPSQAYIAFGLPALISAAAVMLLARTKMGEVRSSD